MLQFVPFLSFTSEQLQIAGGKLTYLGTKTSIYISPTTCNMLVHNILRMPFFLTYWFLQSFFIYYPVCLLQSFYTRLLGENEAICLVIGMRECRVAGATPMHTIATTTSPKQQDDGG